MGARQPCIKPVGTQATRTRSRSRTCSRSRSRSHSRSRRSIVRAQKRTVNAHLPDCGTSGDGQAAPEVPLQSVLENEG